MLELLHRTRNYRLYTLADRPDFLLFTQVRQAGPGRPCTEIESRAPEFIVALRECLLKRDILLQTGGRAAFRFPGHRIDAPLTDDQVRAILTTYMAFGHQYTEAPLTLTKNSAIADLERLPLHEIATVVEDLARNAQGEPLLRLLSLRPTGGYSGLVVVSDDIPELGARLRWPMVGDLPSDAVYEMPPVPAAPGRDYPRLKELFSQFWLDPPSFARVYMYLLGCFDTAYLSHAVPLLTIDSGEQGLGKSEVAEAIANVLHGYRTPAITPQRASTPDQLSNHYAGGHLVAILDNLDGAADWNNSWLASMLTQRGVADRVRYDRASTNFRARSAILTFVWGRATLHPDLISRAWRVSIWGDASRWAAGPPEFFAKDRALECRDELVAECYWAMRRGREFTAPHVTDRCTLFTQRAACGFREVFGVFPDKYLATDGAHRMMLGSTALQFFQRERVAFPRRPVRMEPLPADAPLDLLEGGCALSHEVRDGRVVATTVEEQR